MKNNKIIYIKIDPDLKYQTIDDDANPIEGENNYKVYVHEFPDGKVYVGLTCQDVERRWNNGGKR